MSLSPARGKGVQKKVNAKFAAGAPEVAAVQLLPHRNSLSFVGFGKSVFVPDAHGNSCVRVFSEVGWSDVQFMRQRQALSGHAFLLSALKPNLASSFCTIRAVCALCRMCVSNAPSAMPNTSAFRATTEHQARNSQ